jgi:hypothetical protein
LFFDAAKLCPSKTIKTLLIRQPKVLISTRLLGRQPLYAKALVKSVREQDNGACFPLSNRVKAPNLLPHPHVFRRAHPVGFAGFAGSGAIALIAASRAAVAAATAVLRAFSAAVFASAVVAAEIALLYAVRAASSALLNASLALFLAAAFALAFAK